MSGVPSSPLGIGRVGRCQAPRSAEVGMRNAECGKFENLTFNHFFLRIPHSEFHPIERSRSIGLFDPPAKNLKGKRKGLLEIVLFLIDQFFAGQPEDDTGKQGPEGVGHGNWMAVIK